MHIWGLSGKKVRFATCFDFVTNVVVKMGLCERNINKSKVLIELEDCPNGVTEFTRESE